MRRSALIILLAASLFGQRLLVRVPSGGGGAAPSWVTDRDYIAPFETPPTLTEGQCYDNTYGVKVCRLTSSNTYHAYVMPHAMNPTNRWLSLVNPAGGSKLRWVGDVTGNTVALGPLIDWPSGPVGLTDQSAVWHPGSALTGNAADDYRIFRVSRGSMTESKLWELVCDATNPANQCATSSANWQWNMVRDFASAIDWNNAAFSGLDVATKNSIFVMPAQVSPNGNEMILTMRQGSKDEYGTIRYIRAATPDCPGGNCVFIHYTNANRLATGFTPSSGSAVLTGVQGANKNWTMQLTQWETSNFCASQFSLAYAGPMPTTAGSTYTPQSIINGDTTQCDQLGHGIQRNNGQITFATATGVWWGTIPGHPLSQVAYVGSVRLYDLTQPPNPANQFRRPSSYKFYVSNAIFRQGMHIAGSLWQNRDKWVFPLMYQEASWATSTESQGTTPLRAIAMEIIAVDVTAPDLPAPDPAGVVPLPQGVIRRLGQHFTCRQCTDHTAAGHYNAQGHPNLSMDGTRLLFKSTWNWTSAAGGVSTYMMVLPPDITW